MPRFAFRALTLASLALFAARPTSADVVECDPAIPPHVICLTGKVSNVAGGGPLESGKIHHRSGFLQVPQGKTRCSRALGPAGHRTRTGYKGRPCPPTSSSSKATIWPCTALPGAATAGA